MNSDHLRYLIAIGKEKSMAEASEKLFVTPQALSMAIKKLEEELKLPLLSRSSTGTTLTENGRWLVETAEQFFTAIEKRQQEYWQYLQTDNLIPKGTIDLVVNEEGISTTKLASIVCQISQEYSDVQVNIRELPRQEIEQAVRDETLEMGFIYRTKLNGKFIDEIDEKLAFYPLQSGELVIQAAPHIQLTKSKAISLKKLTRWRFCMYIKKSEHRIEDLFKLCTNENMDCFTTNNYSLYKAKVESGDYLTFSIKMTGETQSINDLPTLRIWPVRDDIMIYFGILRKKDKGMSDNMTFIWHTILAEYSKEIKMC